MHASQAAFQNDLTIVCQVILDWKTVKSDMPGVSTDSLLVDWKVRCVFKPARIHDDTSSATHISIQSLIP